MLTGLTDKIITYDGENRPLSVTHLGKRTCYVYGVDGKRLKKVEGLPPTQDCTAIPANANTTFYFGSVEIRNWLVAGSEQVLTYPHPSVKLLNGTIPAAATYMHRDGLSSVRAITSAAGVKIELAVYKPFGEQSEWLLPGNPAPETKGWIGERFDADAGLQYLNARYYDPELSLFLQPDWFEVTKAGVGTNRFSYSHNDPVNKFDPNGNQDAPSSMSRDEEEELEEKCAGGCVSSLTYGEQMSNVCEAGGCAIVAVGATGGVGILAEFGTGALAAAATLTLGVEELTSAASGIPTVGAGAKASKATREVAAPTDLAKRVDEIHSVLDTKAARHRTTGVLETTDGTRIVAGGVRDLSPAQRAALADGEVAAKQSGAHAEITALDKAAELGLSPSALATSWDICPDCANAIRNLGGVIIDARTAIWK